MANSFNLKKIYELDFGFFALIDPDFKNDHILDDIIRSVNNNNFSAVLIGGSSIHDDKYHERFISRRFKTN